MSYLRKNADLYNLFFSFIAFVTGCIIPIGQYVWSAPPVSGTYRLQTLCMPSSIEPSPRPSKTQPQGHSDLDLLSIDLRTSHRASGARKKLRITTTAPKRVVAAIVSSDSPISDIHRWNTPARNDDSRTLLFPELDYIPPGAKITLRIWGEFPKLFGQGIEVADESGQVPLQEEVVLTGWSATFGRHWWWIASLTAFAVALLGFGRVNLGRT